MSEQGGGLVNASPAQREPVFLLPVAVTALIGVMAAIHLASTLVLNQEGLSQFIFWFAFQPLRILAAADDVSLAIPLIWTPFSHALLHGGWEHLVVNVAWFAIFATPVCRRAAAPLLTGPAAGVAWQAHRGGFFVGILMVGIFERRSN